MLRIYIYNQNRNRYLQLHQHPFRGQILFFLQYIRMNGQMDRLLHRGIVLLLSNVFVRFHKLDLKVAIP